MSMPERNNWFSAYQRHVPAFTIFALIVFVFWPGVHGFWGRDDFFVLAFSRLIGSPWPLFVHDHFPVPGSVFRPLAFAAWWLCTALFGSSYKAQAIVDLALHVCVSLALFGLLRRVDVPRVVAWLCTVSFALHPAVIGTALWWSARSDPLATLFILLALNAAFSYRERRGAGALIGTLAAALAAMLSKEIGLVAIAAVSLIWLRWAWLEPAHRASALRAVALSWLCALTYLGWRWAVLGTLSSGVTVAIPMASAIAQGLMNWLQQAPGYLTFWLRMNVPQLFLLSIAIVGATTATVATLVQHHSQLEWRRHVDLAICGLCLLLLPALFQAPIAALASPLSRDGSAIETAIQSRLYYLGIAGAMAALAAVLAAFWKVSATKLRVIFALSLGLAAFTFANVSRDLAQSFARRSKEISGLARHAVEAVARLDLPQSRCHVMFLDVEPPPDWSIYVSMDSIIKALTPDIDRVKHCWFHSNYEATVYLQPAPVSLADAEPYRQFESNGVSVPWRTIGDLVIAYLRPPENIDTTDLARMKFLRYRDNYFDDVSADEAAGHVEASP